MWFTTKLFALCLAASAAILLVPVRSYKVVRDEDGGLFLVYPKRGVASRIPDERTLAALKLDQLPIANTTKQQLSSAYRMENTSLPSLDFDVKTRDDLMQHEIRKILALSPPVFWKETYYLGHMFNPALTTWHGRTFFTWRNEMYNSPISAAWFSFEKLFRNKHKFDPEDLPKPFEKDYPYFEKIVPLNVKKFEFNQMQEDPRLIPRRNGLLAMMYTSKESLFKPSKMTYCHISFPKGPAAFPTDLTVTNSVLLDGHPFSGGQKNWVALEHKHELYFIQSMNPLVVVQHDGSNGSDPNIGKVRIVHSNTSAIPLPWRSEYGSSIRGGSPAILVKPHHPAHQDFPQYYLSFFHTVKQFQEGFPLRTYFIGAISFCPFPPFHIHAISTHPIVQEKFYDGPWIDNHRFLLDYVMFAISLTQRPNDTSHVYVSFGHQDKDGYLAKFHLGELFASMEIVNSCK